MFEARLIEGQTFKDVVEVIKDLLVSDMIIDCSREEITSQTMDSRHCVLVLGSLFALGDRL